MDPGNFSKANRGIFVTTIVDGGFKAGRSLLGDVVGNFVEGIAYRQLSGKFREWENPVALEARAELTGYPGVHLNDD